MGFLGLRHCCGPFVVEGWLARHLARRYIGFSIWLCDNLKEEAAGGCDDN
jgi:hypothetical protein